jgi:hypothetical protein
VIDSLILCGWHSQGYDCTHFSLVQLGLGGPYTMITIKVLFFQFSLRSHGFSNLVFTGMFSAVMSCTL